ncbi:hypothetical protein B0T20DRAFT_54809 [Sordaria brevicollis]|uniref:Uncharacterized protein n=1 Tax=Sordaria brevicollis TaxID=83679 RepID=A0AAE0U6G7_SORBR|nr:hypothetical protein B0T20DRAFT_54809 [Sordaria brevicollis]
MGEKREAVGINRQVPALPLGHPLLEPDPAELEDMGGVDAALEAEPLVSHRLKLVEQPDDIDLLSSDSPPPPGSLIIFPMSSRPFREKAITPLEAHYPRAWRLYQMHCIDVPANISQQAREQLLQEQQQQQQQLGEKYQPPPGTNLAHQIQNLALDKYQKSLVGTALLIRPTPSFVFPSTGSKEENQQQPDPSSPQELLKKHFIALLFISKESATSIHRDPPVAVLENTRKAMADLMTKVGRHNRKHYFQQLTHQDGSTSSQEVPEDKAGSGGWGKTGIVGRIEEIRMSKGGFSKTKWGVKWEMTKEVLGGLEVKLPGGEGALPSGNGGLEVKVFESMGSMSRGNGGGVRMVESSKRGGKVVKQRSGGGGNKGKARGEERKAGGEKGGKGKVSKDKASGKGRAGEGKPEEKADEERTSGGKKAFKAGFRRLQLPVVPDTPS